jgi:RNA polymerase sigma-70 factor (ECF subfamily)
VSSAGPVEGLVVRARRGDKDAWTALYRESFEGMVAYAYRRLGSVDEAREAVSETMARAVASIDHYRGADDGFRPWLFGILRHVIGDAYRRRRRGRQERAVPDAASEPEQDDGLLMAGDRASVRAAFARLEPDEQRLLELRVLGGLSSQAAATVLGMRPGAVRMAQMRALGRLRVFLEETERVG